MKPLLASTPPACQLNMHSLGLSGGPTGQGHLKAIHHDAKDAKSAEETRSPELSESLHASQPHECSLACNTAAVLSLAFDLAVVILVEGDARFDDCRLLRV